MGNLRKTCNVGSGLVRKKDSLLEEELTVKDSVIK